MSDGKLLALCVTGVLIFAWMLMHLPAVEVSLRSEDTADQERKVS
jgi:hypothetical protein